MEDSIEIRGIKFRISSIMKLAKDAKGPRTILPTTNGIKQHSDVLTILFFEVNLSNLGVDVMTMLKEMIGTLQSLKDVILSNQEKSGKDTALQNLTEVIEAIEPVLIELEMNGGHLPNKVSDGFEIQTVHALIDSSLHNLLTAIRDALDIESSLDELKALNFSIENHSLQNLSEVLDGEVIRALHIVSKAITVKVHFRIEDRTWVPEEFKGLVSDVIAEFEKFIRILKGKGVEEDERMKEIKRSLRRMNNCTKSKLWC